MTPQMYWCGHLEDLSQLGADLSLHGAVGAVCSRVGDGQQAHQ